MDISLKDFLLYAAGILTLVKFGWDFFTRGKKENTDQDIKIIDLEKRMAIMDSEVRIRREFINDEITGINANLSTIKSNHIDHIEKDIQTISNEMTEIRTILNERLPKKQ